MPITTASPLFAVCMGLAFALTYSLFVFLVPKIAGSESSRAHYSVRSMLVLALVSAGLYVLYGMIPNWFWANRIQHFVGGGVMAFVLFYFVIRDTHVQITRLQFFVFGFLVVTALGVANELAEFFADAFTPLAFAPSVYDTWYDLLSNTLGALVAGSILAWRIRG